MAGDNSERNTIRARKILAAEAAIHPTLLAQPPVSQPSFVIAANLKNLDGQNTVEISIPVCLNGLASKYSVPNRELPIKISGASSDVNLHGLPHAFVINALQSELGGGDMEKRRWMHGVQSFISDCFQQKMFLQDKNTSRQLLYHIYGCAFMKGYKKMAYSRELKMDWIHINGTGPDGRPGVVVLRPATQYLCFEKDSGVKVLDWTVEFKPQSSGELLPLVDLELET